MNKDLEFWNCILRIDYIMESHLDKILLYILAFLAWN